MLEHTPDRINALLRAGMVLVVPYGLFERPAQAKMGIDFNASGEPDG